MAKNKDEKLRRPKTPLTEALRLPAGPVDVTSFDADAKTAYPGKGKKDAPDLTAALAPELNDLQERLFAAGRAGDPEAPSVLVILQGMDTSGKGGVIRHAFGLVDPQGINLRAFKAPTKEESSHHYLWRVRRELPKPGMIGIFDRSHYEDVLVPKVNRSVLVKDLDVRYEEINRFEQKMVDAGTTVIKCFLHVSFDEQRERLLARLDNPEKYWKYNPGDVDERAKWSRYQKAYNTALERCNTDAAPWYVIPADRKWYRNWAVAQLLLEKLDALDLSWPTADFDVDEERKRLRGS
ncbi:MAG: PPK2 family polyphosphate kinase [Propionibacteriaceae bacterium]